MTVPELNGLPFIAANIERIMGRLESPSALPDFFLPFEDDVTPPIVQVWREELPALMEDYRRFTGYISAIPDPWTRRVFELRFLSRKSFREIGLEYGILSGTLKQEVYSYLNRNPEGYISCRDLAEALGVGLDAIINYCRRGLLPGAYKRPFSSGSHQWVIPADVDRPKRK